MSEPEIRLIEGEFQRVSLKPDDVIVLSMNVSMSPKLLQHIRERLETVFPGRRCLVLEPGMKIGALGSDGRPKPVPPEGRVIGEGEEP